MEVTQSNFKTLLPQIEEAIRKCTFISIDCELTGLNMTPNNINSFDTPKQYYEKVRKSCRDFLVIQYGLSIFRYDKDKDVFKQQSYNFYIFRRPMDRNIPDQRFLCQTSSIDFLINQGFDFNKLFKEGISYLNISEESKYKQNLEESYKRNTQLKQSQQMGNSDNNIPIPDNVQPFIDDVIEQIDNFLASEDVDIKLPKCSAFHRRLIYQTVNEKYFHKVTLETRQVEKDRILFATRLKNAEELELMEKKRFEQKLVDLDDFAGFTKVLRVIVDAGKLVIGHNLCLDILHSIDKFLTPLPEDYEEFKDCAHSLFPKVLDTKYISSSEPFKELITSTVLKCLLDTVSAKPFEMPVVEIEDGGQGYDVKDNKEHEAGYDAFITGLSFLAMWKYLGSCDKLTNFEIFGNLHLLSPYINRIFLMKLTDNQFIHLGGRELMPSRDHVFYVTFPKEWKMSNIAQLFSPFGNVHISWLDESSAYVGLHKKDQALSVVLNTLSQSDVYSITTFAKRQAELAQASPATPVDRRRKSNSLEASVNKKRRTGSFEGGSSSTVIESEEFQEVASRRSKRQGKASKAAKTFSEDGVWE